MARGSTPWGGRCVVSMLALTGACVEPEVAAIRDRAAVLVTRVDPAEYALRGLGAGEALVLVPDGRTHHLLGYPFDPDTLGLNLGDLPRPAPEDCGARGLGVPTSISRLSFAPGLVLEEATFEELGGVRLPPLDLLACAAREGCLALEGGFAICKPSCETTVTPTPPTPPTAPEPPAFCNGSGCPDLDRPCAAGRNLPGLDPCVELGPCGVEEFRGVAPVGPRPLWVSVTAEPGGDGSQARPLGTLAEALAQGATDVYLSAGDHRAPAQLTAPVRIYGVCPGRTTISGPLRTDHDLGLLGLNLVGGPTTLTVRGAELELREVTFTGSNALAVQLEAVRAEFTRVEIVGAAQAVEAGTSQIQIVESFFGPALQPSTAPVLRAVSSSVALDRVRFDGPGDRVAIAAQGRSRLTARSSAFLGLSRAIDARQTELELTDVDIEVRGDYRHVAEVASIGVLNDSRAVLRRVIVAGATSYAIVVRGSELEVEDLITSDTGAGLPGLFELPTVFIRRGLDASLKRWRSIDEVQPLDTIHAGYRVEVQDLEILGNSGRPLAAIRSESPLGLTRVRIGPRLGPGLTVARGAVVDVRDLAVEGASDGLLFEVDGKLTGERVAITAERGIFGTASGLRLSDLRIEARSAGMEIGEFIGTATTPPELANFAMSVAAGPALSFGAPPRPPLVLRAGTLSGADPGPAARCAPTWGWRIEDLKLER